MSHLNKSVLTQLPHYETIFTTYRDPYRVAAAWANRDRFKGKKAQFDRWEQQWGDYKKLKEFNPLILDFTKDQIQHNIDFGTTNKNHHDDQYSLHKAIDNDDLDTLYNHIPKELMDYAVECADGT